jgi:peptidoglycan/xylan/chitin deacetylase (PgdA/CDA1 family)
MSHMNLSRAKAMVKRTFATTRLGASRNSVLLTFDDGPDAEVTPAILDVLEGFAARSVFFILGNRIHRAPHMLAEILRRGHAIGNHSYSHRASLGISAQLRDYRDCQSEIERLTNYSPRLLRPPEGLLTPATLWAASRLRLRIMLWSVDSGDWKLRSSVAARQRGREMSEDLVSRPGLSEIILFHDDNVNTIAMLEELLPCLRQSGCDLSGSAETLWPGAARRSSVSPPPEPGSGRL